MLAVIKALGNHYDELAKLQADAKVQELTGLQLGYETSFHAETQNPQSKVPKQILC